MPRVANFNSQVAGSEESPVYGEPISNWELKADLTANADGEGSAEALYRQWNADDKKYENSTLTDTIYSVHGRSYKTGAKVKVHRNPESGHLEILDGSGGAGLVIFQVDNASGFATTDASFTATIWKIIGGPVGAGDGVGDQITVQNLKSNKTGDYVYYGDDDDFGWAAFNPEDGLYYQFDMECP